MSTTKLPKGLSATYEFKLGYSTPRGRMFKDPRLVTTCILWDAAGDPVSSAEAMLRPDEPFRADIAQKVSLGRARESLIGKFYAVEEETEESPPVEELMRS